MDTVHISGVHIDIGDAAIFDSLKKIAAAAGKGVVMGGPGAAATGVTKEALNTAIAYTLGKIKGKLDCRRILAAVAGKLQNPTSSSGRAFARSGSASLLVGVKAVGPLEGRRPTTTTAYFRVVVQAEQHGANAGRLNVSVLPLHGVSFLSCCRNDFGYQKTPRGGFTVTAPRENRTAAVSR